MSDKCARSIDQNVTNYFTGDPEHFTVCGHSKGEHGPNGCRKIVGDTYAEGDPEGDPIYCACDRYEAVNDTKCVCEPFSPCKKHGRFGAWHWIMNQVRHVR